MGGCIADVCDFKEGFVMMVGVEKLIAGDHVTSCLPAIKAGAAI